MHNRDRPAAQAAAERRGCWAERLSGVGLFQTKRVQATTELRLHPFSHWHLSESDDIQRQARIGLHGMALAFAARAFAGFTAKNAKCIH